MGNQCSRENLRGNLKGNLRGNLSGVGTFGRNPGGDSLFPTVEYAPVSVQPSNFFGPNSPNWQGPAPVNTSGYQTYTGTDYVMCTGRSCTTNADCCDKYSCILGSCQL